MLIGQPAEEAIGGAKAMLRDGLFVRFPVRIRCSQYTWATTCRRERWE